MSDIFLGGYLNLTHKNEKEVNLMNQNIVINWKEEKKNGKYSS